MFVKRISYFSEDIICKFDLLSCPYSIKTFDYGIILFHEMFVRVYDPLGMKNSQIVQLKDTFISPDTIQLDNCLLTLSANHVLNLFEMIFFAAWFTFISRAETLSVICKIVRNDKQFTVILCTWSFHFIIALAFKCIHNNQRTLLFRGAKFLFLAEKLGKMMTCKKSSQFSKFDWWLAANLTWKSDGNVNLGKQLSDLPWYTTSLGRKEPAAVTTKVVVICLLSSRPLMGTFYDPFNEKVCFPA